MNPRRFLNHLRSPMGALILFLIGLAILLALVNSRQGRSVSSAGSPAKPPASAGPGPQLKQVIERAFAPFHPPEPEVTPTPAPPASVLNRASSSPAPLPSLSLVAETPDNQPKEKTFSPAFAPYGRLIPCELVITVDSSSINTPIIGLVTEDVFHHGQLIIPVGTEVHGSAQVDRTRERIASEGRWTLVWQNGEELSVSGLALDHETEAEPESWAITDGSAGLRGRLIKTDDLAEVKLYAAALLSGAADVLTEKNTSAFGSFPLPSLQNAPLKGAQSVLDRYAQQILATIERDGFYVRVPAGKQFYLYVTQTVDQSDARIGGAQAGATSPEINRRNTEDSSAARPIFRADAPLRSAEPNRIIP